MQYVNIPFTNVDPNGHYKNLKAKNDKYCYTTDGHWYKKNMV